MLMQTTDYQEKQHTKTNKMKLRKHSIISAPSAVLAALALAMAPAQAVTVIYSDDFSGSSGTNLNGQAPDTRPGTETWTASTTAAQWRANGSIAAGSGQIRSAFLPFMPTVGKVYTLSLTINSTNNNTDWLGMGFTQGANTTADFFGTTNNAGPWLFDVGNSGNTTTLLGAGTTGSTPGLDGSLAVTGTNIQHSYSIVLDTNPTLWTATWFRDDVEIRTAAYTTNPTINHIGITRFSTGAGTVDNLSLTVVPEPSSVLLGGLGLLALLRRRR